MDNINKIISFILGLIVVVVFIAIVTGRLGGLGKKVQTLSKGNATPTVTPRTSPQPTKKVTPVAIKYLSPTKTAAKPVAGTSGSTTGTSGTKATQYNANGKTTQIAGNNVSTIPNTGAPTLLLPLAFSMLAGGVFLRKSAKK